jgi:hypothetical protein
MACDDDCNSFLSFGSYLSVINGILVWVLLLAVIYMVFVIQQGVKRTLSDMRDRSTKIKIMANDSK